MMFRRAFCTPACMSVSILGMAQSKLLWTSQTNIVVLEMKSDLAVTSLESSCDPDGGELSLKELRPVKCEDGTFSNDKESIKLSDSNLDKDVLDVQQAVLMPNRVARALKTQARGFLACFAKPPVLQMKNIVSQEFKGTERLDLAMTKPEDSPSRTVPIRALNSQPTSSVAHMPCSIPRAVESLKKETEF